MQDYYWILTFLLATVGLLGSVLPLLPGPALIFAAGVLHRILHPDAGVPGWGALSVLALLMTLAYAVDFLSGAAGAKYFGASRWGAVGGVLGAVVGLFFGLPGLFLGPLIGALAGELLGGKGILPAGQSSLGTLLGTTAGLLAKFFVAVLMTFVLLTSLALKW